MTANTNVQKAKDIKVLSMQQEENKFFAAER